MKEIPISTWEEFPITINNIIREYGERDINGIIINNRFIYRGQADSNWHLESTLERFSDSSWTVQSYVELAIRCVPQIESFTGKEWNIPLHPESFLEKKQDPDAFFVSIPHFEYCTYLRHHGFPSPIMDWTSSPYIAAFFAFAEQNNSEKAAIYIYIESLNGVRVGWGGEPQISVRGHYVKTHKRHFLQQSCYTICSRHENNSFVFSCHEDVFNRARPDQDILIKITIPRSERLKVLSYLNDVNINHFSLFQSEEALMKTLALKEIELDNL